VIWGEANARRTGQADGEEIRVEAPKGLAGRGHLSGQTHHHRNRRAAASAAWNRTRSWSGTYFEAMVPEKMPKSLLVGRPPARIGIEFASFFCTMGADVTVWSAAADPPRRGTPRFQSRQKAFEKQGIKLLINTKVNKTGKRRSDSVIATIDDAKGQAQTIEVDRVIPASRGRNIEKLGLQKLGVKTDRGVIVIDGFCKTMCRAFTRSATSPAADAGAKPNMRAWVCVEAIKGMHPHRMDKNLIPGLHLLPSAGRFRRIDRSPRPKKEGAEIRVGRFPFVGNATAICAREDQGCQVIFDKKTRPVCWARI